MNRKQRKACTYRAPLLAFAGLAAFAGLCQAPAFGQNQASKSLPPGVAACAFDALTHDPDPAGLNIREAPSAGARILGRLPPVESTEPAMGTILPRFRVIGTQDGWFLIEGAYYDTDYHLPKNTPKLYAGRGWVSGKLIATGLRTPTLKAAPDPDAADVVVLSGEAFGPSEVSVRAILGCSGSWFRVEVPLNANGDRLNPTLPSDGPKDSVRGWTTGSCALQLTTCS
ncbi:SH3 domain-containing protein [Methylocapsa sp. S129]|uniref:SH3 domain-containing protein n=1 Tax=Methylocapsa sp. S129 TaxID=1641869 RepID=UPI00131D83CC|nr:SH3 domain-containing protein [Methylocapsa sp. S129]